MNFTPIQEKAPVVPETFNAPMTQISDALDSLTAVKLNVGAAPERLGQLAVVGGIGYLATGTASAADWKQITN